MEQSEVLKSVKDDVGGGHHLDLFQDRRSSMGQVRQNWMLYISTGTEGCRRLSGLCDWGAGFGTHHVVTPIHLKTG